MWRRMLSQNSKARKGLIRQKKIIACQRKEGKSDWGDKGAISGGKEKKAAAVGKGGNNVKGSQQQ